MRTIRVSAILTAMLWVALVPTALGCVDDKPPEETLLPCTNLVEGSFGINDDVPRWQCNLPDPCPEAQYFDQEMPRFEEPNAARCILEKLRDRTIAKLSYRYDFGLIAGQYSDQETIYIVDSEHGLSDIYQARDLGSTQGTNNRAVLAPVSYFEEFNA